MTETAVGTEHLPKKCLKCAQPGNLCQFPMLTVILVLLLAADPTSAEHKSALIITTGSSEAITGWRRSVSAALTRRDFRTTDFAHTDSSTTRTAIQAFTESAPINGVALVLLQSEFRDGATFDDRATPMLFSDRGEIPLIEILERLFLHSATATNLVVLDAMQSEGAEHLPELPHQNIPPNTWVGFLNRARTSGDKTDEAPLKPDRLFLRQLNREPEVSIYRILPQLCDDCSGPLPESTTARDSPSAVTDPDDFPGHRSPGDEWVTHNGSVYCYCPASSTSPGFWVGKYEVTEGKLSAPGRVRGMGDSRNLPTTDLPVEYVRRRLKQLTATERSENRLTDGWEYRLPAADEWERAARGDCPNDRYFEEQQIAQNANFADLSLFRLQRDEYLYAHQILNDGFPQRAPVGSFQANAFGLHDVLGNVWELTASGELRGGSWVSLPDYCRFSVRKPPLKFPSDYVGLRIVIAPCEQ